MEKFTDNNHYNWFHTTYYHVTRQVPPRTLSLQNYWENPCMRAVRDGASRTWKSRPALLGSCTAFIREFSQEFCNESAQWSYNKMLIDWVRSGCTGKYLALGHCTRTLPCTPWPRAKYFPVRPSHSVNKYIVQLFKKNSDHQQMSVGTSTLKVGRSSKQIYA